MNNQLTKGDIQKIQSMAREKLVAYSKLNDVIGAQIFSILERESKVLYYPLDDPEVWGFSETIKGKSFVCINTSLPFDKQVFSAAHELYHVWFGANGDIMLSKDKREPDCDSEVEWMANRFAAEFLINEELLLQEMRVFGINRDEITMKDIVKLMTQFVVPYRTIIKRLYEVGAFSLDQYEKFSAYPDEHAEIWRSRLGLAVPVRKHRIGLGDLTDKGMELYEKRLITYEKLLYLLEFAGLTPSEMGIEQNENYQQVTDEELDAIMEE